MRSRKPSDRASSSFSVSWRPLRVISTNTGPWTLKCCDILQCHASCDSDVVLATLTRLCSINAHAADAIYDKGLQTREQRQLLLLGLDTQYRDLRSHLPISVSSVRKYLLDLNLSVQIWLFIGFENTKTKLMVSAHIVPVKLATLFTELYLNTAGLIPRYTRSKSLQANGILEPQPAKLSSSVASIRQFQDLILSLDRCAILGFSAIDWCRFVLVLTMAIRLSFPIADCCDFDSAWARSELRLGDFLQEFCKNDDSAPGLLPTASPNFDVLSASRVVFGMVKSRFEKRMAAIERENEVVRGAQIGCPMLDGSLDQYFPQWDAELNASAATMQPNAEEIVSRPRTAQASVIRPGLQNNYHDMWATMTMGWSKENW